MMPLIKGLLDPAAASGWSNRQWDCFLRQARNLDLLGKFAHRAEGCAMTSHLSATIKERLIAASRVAAHHRRIVDWETRCIRNVLAPQGIAFVLLKGAAYIMGDLPAGQGRKVSDIDILVRKEELEATEQALLSAGWEHTKSDAYDQAYYRRWMHELPPLKHRHRKTLVDVHHTILPESGRLHPDPKLLWEKAQPSSDGRWLILCPQDMVLHSAAHLFQDGDLDGGLRDLFDLDDLMRHFSASDPDFWMCLVPRAVTHDLARPMYYALIFCREILATPIPDDVMSQAVAGAPNRVVNAWMKCLCTRTLLPFEADGSMRSHSWAKRLLYMRSHWLRMPPLLLAKHLSHKLLRS
jgi:hypothetical protein